MDIAHLCNIGVSFWNCGHGTEHNNKRLTRYVINQLARRVALDHGELVESDSEGDDDDGDNEFDSEEE